MLSLRSFSLFVFVALLCLGAVRAQAASSMHAPTATDTRQLKALDSSLQKSKALSMKFDKSFTQAILDKKEKSTGTMLVSKGRLRMEINPPNQKLVIVGPQGVWAVEYPPAEFKDAKLQVSHATSDKKSAAMQGLLGSLLKGKLTSFFKILNVALDEKGQKTFFLSPAKLSPECNRAEAMISKDGKELRGLRYWDEQGNQTEYTFSDIKMDATVTASDFEYTPPKNADVTPF